VNIACRLGVGRNLKSRNRFAEFILDFEDVGPSSFESGRNKYLYDVMSCNGRATDSSESERWIPAQVAFPRHTYLAPNWPRKREGQFRALDPAGGGGGVHETHVSSWLGSWSAVRVLCSTRYSYRH
jgi:hypothetical protein